MKTSFETVGVSVRRRCSRVLLAAFLSVAACFAARAQAAGGADRPNILFIFSDDHGTQAISAYGSRINRTPNIDAIAHEGMRFDNCFVTNSICGPSRAVIITGKYSHLNGFYHNRNKLNPDQTMVSRLLQQAGYNTAIIGKWHLTTDPPGFDHYEVLNDQGTYYNPEMFRDGQKVRYTGYTTNIITDLALDWLKDDRDKSKPFFLMYQHKSPHRPWDPAPEYFNVYEDQLIPEPLLLLEDLSARGTPARQSDMQIGETLDDRDLKFIPPAELNAEQLAAWNAAYVPRNARFRDSMLTGDALIRWKYQRFIKDYLRCVAAMDDGIGRVLKYLDDSGLSKSTIVIYSSDQGFFLGEHGWFDKRWMYETSLRTPLLVRWPGVTPPDSFCNAIVSNLDFAPTFLDIAGAKIPDDMQGRSLVPLLRGDNPPDWRTIFYYHYYEYPGWHFVRRHDGVTDARFKLIHFYEPDVNTWELYDVKFDPFEINNLISNPEYDSVKKRLMHQLEERRKALKVTDSDPPESDMGDFPPRTRIKKLAP
ncbi:MAG: sulfatase [Phycisphaeraceae bacterium]|nr:sulfatase [Phycisphaeraceae bacterium]